MNAPIRVVSPSTGQLVREVPDEGAEGVDAAVARARAAGVAWAGLPYRDRVLAMKRFRKLIVERAEEIAETLVEESGKPYWEALGAEVTYICEVIRFSIGAARRVRREETRNPFLLMVKKTRLVRKPLGVVGVIGPWNFPILNNAADCVGPLLLGNTVVLKPSEVTPLTSLLLRDLWVAAGNPPDVFQVVTGRGEAGARVVDLVDAVMFTGSVSTGRRVAARCGERLIPCVTELGGKSPFVVLAGANLGRAVEAAVWSSFFHSGQACIRSERIIVDASLAEEFEKRFVERVKALRQEAPGKGKDHDLGAVTFLRQIEIVERQIAEATSKGARVLTGGARRADLPGQFFPPTVLGGETPAMEAFREETFGPLVGIVRVKDAEEALRLANDSHLGLNATVFGPEPLASQIARRIESGNVIVNDAMLNYFCVEAPLGGFKASGVGVRHGVEGLRNWVKTTSLTTRRPLLAPVDRYLSKLFAFPYSNKELGLLRLLQKIYYG